MGSITGTFGAGVETVMSPGGQDIATLFGIRDVDIQWPIGKLTTHDIRLSLSADAQLK